MSDPKNASIAQLLAFLLAFCAGYVAAWAVSFTGMTRLFSQEDPQMVGLVPILFAPLAGLAVFQLLFGMTGRWRNWRFWLIAPPVVYVILLVVSYLSAAELFPLWTGLVLAAALMFLAGIWAIALTKPGD